MNRPTPNGHETRTEKPVLIGEREEVKVKEPFKPFPYAEWWKKQTEELRKP